MKRPVKPTKPKNSIITTKLATLEFGRTVGNLIEYLQTLPKNAVVEIEGYYDHYDVIVTHSERPYSQKEFDKLLLQYEKKLEQYKKDKRDYDIWKAKKVLQKLKGE